MVISEEEMGRSETIRATINEMPRHSRRKASIDLAIASTVTEGIPEHYHTVKNRVIIVDSQVMR